MSFESPRQVPGPVSSQRAPLPRPFAAPVFGTDGAPEPCPHIRHAVDVICAWLAEERRRQDTPPTH